MIFAYRKLPIESQPNALKAVAILSVITQIEPKIIGSFIADAYKVFDFVNKHEQTQLVNILYKTIKESPVAPIDFIKAFETSRRLILSRKIDPNVYLNLLRKALESGVEPEKVNEYMQHEISE